MKKIIALMIPVLLASTNVGAVTAESECHTGGTRWDGKPKTCGGEVCITAYRIKHSSATIVKTNGYGDVHECHQPVIRDVEEEDGGKTQRVTKMCASLNARSPSGSGNAGKRGTVRCKLSAEHWDN